MQTNLKRFKHTGRAFPTSEVWEGHKRGQLCLRCGIYCKALNCENCDKFDKCELCGIVCKVNPTNKLYMYSRDPANKAMSLELVQEVKTICQVLDDGLCEDCLKWEYRIKWHCFICDENFTNSYKHFLNNGNCCLQCSRDLIQSIKIAPKDARWQRFKKLPKLTE